MKKKTLFRLIALLSVFCLLLPLLIACGGDEDETESGEPGTTPAQTVDKIFLTIPLSEGDDYYALACKVEKKLKALGYETVVGTDSEKRGNVTTEEDYEICFGLVNRTGAAAFSAAVGDCGWGVQVSGKKLFLYGSGYEMLEMAAESLGNKAFTDRTDPFGAIRYQCVSYEDLICLVKDGVNDLTISGDMGDAGVVTAVDYLKEKITGVTKEKSPTYRGGTVTVDLSVDETMNYNLYRIHPIGDKNIDITAHDADGLLAAAKHFFAIVNSISDYRTEKALYFPQELTVDDNAQEGIPSVPLLEHAQVFTGNLDPSYTLTLDNATKKTFEDYCDALVAEGFELKDTRTKQYEYEDFDKGNASKLGNTYENEYRTYIKDNGMAYAYFTGGTGHMRVVCQPAKQYEQLTAINSAAATDKYDSVFAMLDIGRLKQIGQGLCLVWILSDGRFVIVDGGQWDDKGTEEIERLHQWLVDNSPTGEIDIACWIFTHNHSDHINVAWKFEQMYRDSVTIERYLYNFPSFEYSTSIPGTNMDYDYYKVRYPRMQELFSRYECMIARTGQTYQFANLTIDILYTHDDFFPQQIKSFNNSSTAFMFTINGQSFLVAGDLEEPGQQGCCDQNGNLLKADYVQATHHGYNGLELFYHYGAGDNKDAIALWPLPFGAVKAMESNWWLRDHAKANYYSSDGHYQIYLK